MEGSAIEGEDTPARRRINELLNLIRERAGKSLTWDENGTTFINGVPLKNSNILDLAREVTVIRAARRFKNLDIKTPPGWKEFTRQLSSLNIPRTIVQNKRRFLDIYGSPAISSPRNSKKKVIFTPTKDQNKRKKVLFSPSGVTPKPKYRNPYSKTLEKFLLKDFK